MRFSSDCLSKLSCALLRLYSVTSRKNLPAEFLHVAGKVINCEQLAYNEFTLGRLFTIHDPDISEDLNDVFLNYKEQHPSIEYIKKTKTREAVKISDFLTWREWRRTDLYNEFFRKIQIKYQIAFMLSVGNTEIGFTANRERRDFSESDRFLLTMLAAHFSQALENVAAFEKTYERLHQIGDSKGAGGTIVIDREGKIIFCSNNAADCIAAFFGEKLATCLPEDLDRWVKVQIDSYKCGSLSPSNLQPLCIEGENERLTIRFIPNHLVNEHILVIEEEQKSLSVSTFKKFGLTNREVEVLNWVILGKTNPEIAIVLGISVKTVGHHVEHIMRKVGVERRGGAALWAQQVLRLA